MGLGWTEILLIAAIGLLFFAPGRLPAIGKALGQTVRGLKKGLSQISSDATSPNEIVVEDKKHHE